MNSLEAAQAVAEPSRIPVIGLGSPTFEVGNLIFELRNKRVCSAWKTSGSDVECLFLLVRPGIGIGIGRLVWERERSAKIGHHFHFGCHCWLNCEDN